MVPIVPPWRASRISGRVNSITVPRWAVERRRASTGSRSSGWFAVEPRLDALRERFHGVLLIITVTTNGKWRLSFEDAAPHQMQTKTICAATIRLSSGNRKMIIRLP